MNSLAIVIAVIVGMIMVLGDESNGCLFILYGYHLMVKENEK